MTIKIEAMNGEMPQPFVYGNVFAREEVGGVPDSAWESMKPRTRRLQRSQTASEDVPIPLRPSYDAHRGGTR